MYLDELEKILHTWMGEENPDEWLFDTFRNTFVKVLEPSQAFAYIDRTVDLLLAQENKSASVEMLEIIICLARTSRTTEVPISLIMKKKDLDDCFSSSSEYAKNKLKELYRYYKI